MLMFNNEPNVNLIWHPDQESIKSYFVKQDLWRKWYMGLSRDEQIEYSLRSTDKSCLNRNNTHIQALIKIKGEKYVCEKYGIKTENEPAVESKMSSLQQTFEGF